VELNEVTTPVVRELELILDALSIEGAVVDGPDAALLAPDGPLDSLLLVEFIVRLEEMTGRNLLDTVPPECFETPMTLARALSAMP
jgi:acyl carrier protein